MTRESHISDAVLLGACEFTCIILCKVQGTITIMLKMLGDTVQNLVAWVTLRLEIVPPWSAVHKTELSDPKCEN